MRFENLTIGVVNRFRIAEPSRLMHFLMSFIYLFSSSNNTVLLYSTILLGASCSSGSSKMLMLQRGLLAVYGTLYLLLPWCSSENF